MFFTRSAATLPRAPSHNATGSAGRKNNYGAPGRSTRRVRLIRNRLVRVRKEIYSKEKEKYQVTEIDITLDTDDKEEQEREYINNITSRIMEIANDYIHRHPNIDICTSQGITELFKDIKRKYKADIYDRNLLGGLYRENPVKSRNYEAVKSSKKWENVGNSYIIPALLLYRYSYI